MYGRLSPNPTLISDLKAGNFSAIASSASDIATIKSALASLAGLSTLTISGYVSSISTTVKYATSPDGVTWTDGGGVTFPTTTWDQFISSVNVIKDGSTYKMWYTGFTVNALDLQNVFIALSNAASSLTSADTAILFGDIVNGNIVGLKSELSSLSLKTPILNILTSALTFASASAPQIGYASSPDGITWTKYASNPVMKTDQSGDWDNLGVMTPSVIKNGSTYQMWYTGINVNAVSLETNLMGATSVSGIETALVNGVNVAICYATSPDGYTWTKNFGPVLQKSSLSTDWNGYGVFAPSVVLNADGTYSMWYTGGKGSLSTLFSYLNKTVTLNNLFLTGASTAIGCATSTNGTTWTQAASNPILNEGSGNAWDNSGVAFPSAIASTGHVQLWYTGVTISPTAALTSFLNGGTLASIVIAGTGTSAKIGVASVDATLSNLTISSGSLSPAFASGTTSYTDSVASGTTSVTVTPTVNQSGATVKVNTVAVTSGSASAAINLNVGANTITVIVTGADGITTDTYTITVTVASPPAPPVTTTTSTTTTTTTTTAATTTTTTTPPQSTVTIIQSPTTTTSTTTSTTTTPTTPITTSLTNTNTTDLTGDENSSGTFTSAATASSADGDITVNIPEGVTGLTASGQPITAITISQITSNPPTPPSGDGAVGLTYDIEPTGATFSSPITLTFSYDPSLVPAGSTPYGAWYNPSTGKWEQLTTVSIDTVNHTITVSVNHFSTFAVLAPLTNTTSPGNVITSSTTSTSTTSSATPWVLTIIIIAVGVIVLAGLGIWLLRTRKK